MCSAHRGMRSSAASGPMWLMGERMRAVGTRWLLALCMVLGVGVTPFSALALQGTASGKTVNVELIVDASGSMGAATDTGTLRIDAAKQVLNEVIAAIPNVDGVNVGLRVYGHRGDNTEAGRPESCQSTELLVPLDGVDASGLKAQVEAIQPVGWTPLGLALQEAANDFTAPASDDVVNAIVMVTDGLETCDADPVAIAKQLHDSDKGIITHVIGFGTTPEEQATLSGIAQSGGGELLGSNNAGQLMDALFSILEQLDVVEETGTGESRESPLGVGRIGRVGDYDISVISVSPNATDEIMAINQYNELSSPDNQFFQARVAITYRGVSTGKPGSDLNFQSVGELAASYTQYFDQCGVIADPLFMVNDLFPGGSTEANICWQINVNDASTLVMYVEPNSIPNAESTWFSLGNPIEKTVNPDATQAVTTPTPRVAKTNTPRPALQSATDSSRTQPITVGESGKIGDYSVTVVDVTRDATQQVLAINPYNELSSPDKQMLIARIRVRYEGDALGKPGSDLQFNSVGELGSSYTTWGDDCGVYDEPIYMVNDLFPEGEAEANLCWEIDSGDEESLLLYVETNSNPRDTAWFSLGGSQERVKQSNTPAPSASAGDVLPATSIELSATDIKFEPKELTIPADTDVSITVTNNGVLQHDFAIESEGIESGLLNSGESADVVVNLPAGTYDFICTVPGHKEAGMVGTLIVE